MMPMSACSPIARSPAVARRRTHRPIRCGPTGDGTRSGRPRANDAGGLRLRRACLSSSSTPQAPFGCTKATRQPPAPTRGAWSRSGTPRAFISSSAASRSSTSTHTWWRPERFSRKRAMTDDGSVGSSSSRCDSPTGQERHPHLLGRDVVGRLDPEAERLVGGGRLLEARHRDAEVVDLQVLHREPHPLHDPVGGGERVDRALRQPLQGALELLGRRRPGGRRAPSRAAAPRPPAAAASAPGASSRGRPSLRHAGGTPRPPPAARRSPRRASPRSSRPRGARRPPRRARASTRSRPPPAPPRRGPPC